jgi:hypothetical protein
MLNQTHSLAGLTATRLADERCQESGALHCHIVLRYSCELSRNRHSKAMIRTNLYLKLSLLWLAALLVAMILIAIT